MSGANRTRFRHASSEAVRARFAARVVPPPYARTGFRDPCVPSRAVAGMLCRAMNESPAAAPPPALLRRFVDLRAGEGGTLLLSTFGFFCVLASYFVLKPLRDEIGIAEAALPFVGEDIWNAYELSWLDLRGKPVVALIQAHGAGHYVCIRGISRGWVYYYDPAAGEAKSRVADFAAAWHDADRLNAVFRSWGVVAYPR